MKSVLAGAMIALSGVAAAQAPAPAVATPTAQLPASDASDTTRGAELTVYLMTMGYGDQVWERFGHNAIRIVDAARGTDSVYNWGTFDFAQPHFLRRFMTGNTLYWMQGDGMAETIATYRYLNRSVWVQELDLTPAERESVREFIDWNARPENRYYRYDYYLDNCSTRVRDVLDRLTGGQLRAQTASRLTSTTYRFHTQRALQFDPMVALGTDIGLGEVADRPISEWEEAFLPTRLMDHVRHVVVRDRSGRTHPLVKSEQQLLTAQRLPEPTRPPDETARNLIIGVVLAAVIAGLGRAAARGVVGTRKAFGTFATTWAALNGLLGVILIVGWAATRHIFMAWNENLLQFDPLSLGIAVALPMALARGRAVAAVRMLSGLVALIGLIGFAMQLLPWFDQVNGAVIALTLPAHIALAWAVRGLTFETEATPARKPGATQAFAPRTAT